MKSPRPLLSILFLLAALEPAWAEPPVGYYRQPALHGDTIAFVAEGDLWRVRAEGGTAVRMTTHPGRELDPAISPDGRTLAFGASYEGARDLYTMPLDGGLPVRRTYGESGALVSGFVSNDRLLYTTQKFSTLPNWQLVVQDVGRDDVTGAIERIPLAQAADGWYDASGETLFFTRLRFQGSHTKRYRGGTAQQIWSFTPGDEEAVPLTTDYAGTSKRPMVWDGRVFFASDRDGTMNLWSMNPSGGDLRQHTRHAGWDVKSPDLHAGRIVYQLGADLRLFDIASGRDRAVPIVLGSDLDQLREQWVEDPFDYLSSTHVSKNGDRVALTIRGRVFVAPREQGRLVEVTRTEGVRYREARFMPDGKSLIALSDESGEVELWKLPANGVGAGEQLTSDGEVLRWDTVPSPDGRRIAHRDKNQRLFVLDTETDENLEIDRSEIRDLDDLAWSPDSQWLAYVSWTEAAFARIKIYDVERDESHTVTTERYNSYAPSFSPDGKWLYFISDRHLRSIVGSPWGSYQPEPYLHNTSLLYQLGLTAGLRSPFAKKDELQSTGDDEKSDEPKKKDESKKKDDDKKEETVEVVIDFDGLERRLYQLPLPPGDYHGLEAGPEALFWIDRDVAENRSDLRGAAITHERGDDGYTEAETVVSDIRWFELTGDRKQILVRKGSSSLYVIDAKPNEADLDDRQVDLSHLELSVMPREEWRQMFDEAWRLERDYFYDQGMHGVDWPAMRDKYRPLVARVTDRDELADLIAQMVSELSALHIFVRGGDHRSGEDDVDPSDLGAMLRRDEPAGGYRVEHVYATDPDAPWQASPLARPEVGIGVGDVILAVNGQPALTAPDIGALLRSQADRQVLLQVAPAGGGDPREAIVRPITLREAYNLRYHEWEYTRRLETDERGEGQIGYVHLRAMGRGNYTEWARSFYPVYLRKGLIIDVRHNRGGNIDSWILGRLLRRPWFYWSQRVGRSPSWNMQYAFHGHVVVLCNERTASDGEAFTEGIRRLGIGTIIGTRTWGGEIWLTSSNRLVDRGIATAAEFGVFSPEGEWLIEGHGVEPDIVVDNPPHATFNGRDAQLEAAIDFLRKKIEEEPIEIPPVPVHPDLSVPTP